MTDKLAKNPEDYLTQVERDELQRWRRSDFNAALSTVSAAKMYQLFLLGHTCDEIARVNEGIPLGTIIDARMRHEWDRRRESYIEQIYNEATTLVKQRQVESAFFLGDVLAAAHVQFGDKLKKFIMTKNPDDLPEQLKITSITTYKMVIDALMKITGQEGKRGGDDKPSVQVIGNNVTLQEGSKGTMGGEDAFTLLKALDRMDKDKK